MYLDTLNIFWELLLDLRKAPPSPGQIISAGSGLSALDVPMGTSPLDKPLPTRADLTLERAVLRKSSLAKKGKIKCWEFVLRGLYVLKIFLPCRVYSPYRITENTGVIS